VKPISSILIIAFIIVSCDNKPVKKSDQKLAYEYYSNGKLKSETEVNDDTLAHGIRKTYASDGTLQMVHTFVEGKREGPAVSYYPDGKLRQKMLYKDNKRTGLSTIYYKSGKVFRETPYTNGQIHGIRKSYHENGQLLAEVPYKDGFPGTGLKEYNPDGEEIKDNVKIIINPENHLAFANRYYLKISLSEKKPSSSFYIGKLNENKYLHDGLLELKPEGNGVATHSISIPKGGFAMETLFISAQYQTEKGSIRVLTREYNLAVDNK
jgi:hypothetical protein